MLESVFIVNFDEKYHGFIVEKRYPSSLAVTERLLNTVWYNHQKDDQTSLKLSEVDERRYISFMSEIYPNRLVCYEISEEDDANSLGQLVSGMSALILELQTKTPEAVELEEILKSRSTLPKQSEEQQFAEVFLTPSTSMIMERLQTQGVESAAKLSIWLKSQVQGDTVDIREAIAPLIKTEIVKVEMIGKTREMVFLLKDVFCYRAPPVSSLTKIIETQANLAQKYVTSVKSFFSPPPPEKGYNPTIATDEPNSPIVEDRQAIATVIADRLHYIVMDTLRSEPLSVEQISKATSLPVKVVQNSLWALESHRIAAFFEDENLWALVTNPTIMVFMPEYAIPYVNHKMVDKDINSETASRYYQLLSEVWSEKQ
jgi:hypothetical protein